MKQYIGTKIIKAWPARRCTFIGGKVMYACVDEIVPAGCNTEEGYRVEYADGYLSWSPKAVFEEAYRPTDGMNFGLAIEAVKKGLRIAVPVGTARVCGWCTVPDIPKASPATRIRRMPSASLKAACLRFDLICR